jgi:hypothetical protein
VLKAAQDHSQLQEELTNERMNWQREKSLLEERIEQQLRDIENVRDTCVR